MGIRVSEDREPAAPPRERKRRGRPQKYATPDEQPAPGESAEERKPRRTRRLSRAAKREQLAHRLMGVHYTLALLLSCPPLAAIDEPAASAVAEAAYDCAEEWGFDLDAVGGKWGALIGFVAIVGKVYFPIAVGIAQWRAAMLAQARAAQAAANGAGATPIVEGEIIPPG